MPSTKIDGTDDADGISYAMWAQFFFAMKNKKKKQKKRATRTLPNQLNMPESHQIYM